MSRKPSFNTNPELVAEFIDTAYDHIKLVADNIDGLLLLGGDAASAAQVSAIESATHAAEALANKVLTDANLIATNNDTLSTAADLQQIITERAAVQVILDTITVFKADVIANLALTNQDAIYTALDKNQTGLDRIATNADLIQTGLDRIQVTADRILTGADVVAAEDWQLEAKDWVNRPEDQLTRTFLNGVGTSRPSGYYSARHWEAKAKGAAALASISATQSATDAAATAADRAQTAADRQQTTADAANSTTQAGIATTQASTATTQAGIATTKAGEAASSASAALDSETAAAGSESAAAGSAADAAASFDAFDDRYLGAKVSAPTLDNAGSALVVGALYLNTTDDLMYVYTSALTWVTVSNFASSTAAANSASAALTSEGNAATSESNALTSESNAATSASIATNHANNVTTTVASAAVLVNELREILDLAIEVVDVKFSKIVDEDGYMLYLGEAIPGTPTSAAAWRIMRVDSSLAPDITVMYAVGVANQIDFIHTWDDRLSLTYG